jgi:LPS export ABC transporter protein LptC
MSAPRSRRVARLFASALVAAGLAAALRPPSAAAEERPQKLDLTKVTYVDSDGSRNGVVLQASEARVMPRVEEVVLQNVDLRLATADAKGQLHLRCDHGELDLRSGNFVGIGSVRGRTPDGKRFETDRMRYDHEAGLVTTDAPVLIRDAGGSLRGGGFRYQVREGRLTLMGGATVVQGQ